MGGQKVTDNRRPDKSPRHPLSEIAYASVHPVYEGALKSANRGQRGIPLGEFGFCSLNRPFDSDTRIVPNEPLLSFRRIIAVGFVSDLGIILQCAEGMSEATRNKKLVPLSAVSLSAPSAESLGSASQVHRDIKD